MTTLPSLNLDSKNKEIDKYGLNMENGMISMKRNMNIKLSSFMKDDKDLVKVYTINSIFISINFNLLCSFLLSAKNI
jgi:hypothetical protein